MLTHSLTTHKSQSLISLSHLYQETAVKLLWFAQAYQGTVHADLVGLTSLRDLNKLTPGPFFHTPPMAVSALASTDQYPGRLQFFLCKSSEKGPFQIDLVILFFYVFLQLHLAEFGRST